MSLWYDSNLILIQSTFISLVFALSIQIPVRWGVLTFGSLGCFAIGGYVAGILTLRTELPQILILLVAVACGGFTSLLLGLLCARLDGMYLAMASLAFDLIIGVIALNGGALTGGVDGLYGVVADIDTATLAVLGLIALAIALYTERGRTGRATSAVRDDPELAVSQGIDVRRYRWTAFLVSGLLAGCAGVMYVRVNTTITPDNIQFGALVVAMTMVIIGGWKSSFGTLAGAIIFTWLPSQLGPFATWQTVIYSALVFLAAVLVPTGAAGVFVTLRGLLRSRRPTPDVEPVPARESAPEPHGVPPERTDGPLLEVSRLAVHYGGVKAVDDISFTVDRGEIFGLLGPNGSGKSTLLAALTRMVQPVAGEFRFDGIDCTHLTPHELGRRGVARTFQAVRLLDDLRVIDNVMLGGDRAWSGHQRPTGADALGALERVGLAGTALAFPGELSYGRQRRVEIARAIVGRPEVLLLDEPVAGMNRQERTEIAALLRSLRDEGMTVVIVEHDVELMVAICDRLLALNFGREITVGAPAQVVAHPAVIEAYLGRQAAVDA